MNKLDKFKAESLEINKALNVKGGVIATKSLLTTEGLLGGDNTGCTDSVPTSAVTGGDRRYHRYNDNGSYNGFEDIS